MTTAVADSPLRVRANATLRAAAQLWFLVAVIGQWMFAYYVGSFYGGSAVQGDLEVWNNILPHGYVVGETMGNVAVAVHLFLAVIILVGGPLQLVPHIRARVPAFHRLNGRIYMLTAFVISISGLFMVWTRGSAGGPMGDISISINAVLIMIFAVVALRYAVARDIKTHRRWALRLFLVVSGVWFFRIGLMLWLTIHNGPVGFDMDTFRGPFLTFLGFAQYLLPLAILEIYLRTQDRAGATGRFVMAATLVVLTITMGVGIFAATVGMWLPYL